VAEFKDEQFRATLGNTRARSFQDEDILAQNLQVAGFKISSQNGVTDFSAPQIRAQNFKTKDYAFQGVTASNLRGKDRTKTTDVQIANVQAQSGQLKDNKLR